MIFKYTESGTIDIGGKTVDSSIDTLGAEYVDRAEWIARRAGVQYLGTEITSALSPGDMTTNYTGTARFQLGSEPAVGVDALAVRYSPISGLASVAGIYGLNVEISDYVEPKPPAPPEDWQAPGARIGPPLPGRPGRWSSRNDGSSAGATWQHPSGRTYRLRYDVLALGVGLWSWELV
jgi:hypothetical protein